MFKYVLGWVLVIIDKVISKEDKDETKSQTKVAK